MRWDIDASQSSETCCFAWSVDFSRSQDPLKELLLVRVAGLGLGFRVFGFRGERV